MRSIPSEVIMKPADGVPTSCAISLENITTIRLAILDKRITDLAQPKLLEVFAAIRYVFNMQK